MERFITAFIFVFLFSIVASPARAQISSNFGGTNGGAVVIGESTTTCDSSIEGALRYNSSNMCVEFCDNTNWVCPGWSLIGPSGCTDIGDLCADGTVFAGYHPITQAQLFIPTVDQEQPGSPGTYTMNWKNALGTNDISTDSSNDGQINHANRGGDISSFQAFQACEDLSAGGHNDWYLPSQVEIYYLYTVHDTIEAGGNITNFQNNVYWSSTEYNTNGAWAQNFNDSNQINGTKTSNYRVRCVRR